MVDFGVVGMGITVAIAIMLYVPWLGILLESIMGVLLLGIILGKVGNRLNQISDRLDKKSEVE